LTRRDLIGVVFTQRLMSGPGESFAYFWEPLAAAVAAVGPADGGGVS
jgi:hypothetical protein